MCVTFDFPLISLAPNPSVFNGVTARTLNVFKVALFVLDHALLKDRTAWDVARNR